MGRDRTPVTPAIRALRAAGITFNQHTFDYDRYPGAAGASRALGLDPHQVIKTLVMETSEHTGLIILMHGDREVSLKELARQVGLKSVEPATADQARRWTGYEFGGTSPFGLRTTLPLCAEESIEKLAVIHVNGGKRGFLVSLAADDAFALLTPRLVRVAI